MNPNEQTSSGFPPRKRGRHRNPSCDRSPPDAEDFRSRSSRCTEDSEAETQVPGDRGRKADAFLILRELQRAGFEFEWEQVDTEPGFLVCLDPSFDLILADFRLPGGFDGLRALRIVQQRGLDIPLIIISGAIGDDLGAKCIKQGASDRS